MHAVDLLRCSRSLPLFVLVAFIAEGAVGVQPDHPLFRAVRDRDHRRVDQLLRQGTPVDLQAADGTTSLMVAALHGDARTVERLLEQGADPNIANRRGATALLWAVSEAEKVRSLLQRGANVNARSALGNTPLLAAAALPGESDSVEALLAGGAELTVRNRRGRSALAAAVSAGNVHTVRLLLARARTTRCVEDLVGDDSQSLLSSAASLGDLEMIRTLGDRLSELNGGEFPASGQALHLGLLAQRPEIAHYLLDHEAPIDRYRQPGRVPTILLAASDEADRPSVLEALIARGFDATECNDEGESALTWARRRGHPAMIATLVAAGTPDPPDPRPELPDRDVNLHRGNQQRLLTDAITKGLGLLSHSSDVFLERRKTCVSCHHQNLPAVAIGWARDRGIAQAADSVDRMVRRQTSLYDDLLTERCYQVDRPTPVPPRLLGYGLWGLSALGFPASESTDALVWYLAATQRPDGRWSTEFSRPPMGDGDFVATVLAMRSLQSYPIHSRREEFGRRVERAARWLEETAPTRPQEQVFQLLGLGWAGRSQVELGEYVDRLLDLQRDDGGWSQLPNLASDAWATGQTLVALRIAGGISTDHESYQRGLRFLLNTQFPDGSWFVQSRSFPFQPPFDSEFPHGRNQWISAPATAWAVMAMTLAVSPTAATLRPNLGTAEPSGSITSSDGPSISSRPSADGATEPADAVSFADDIRPILERSCIGCHSGENPESNLAMNTLSPLLEGGDSGRAAIVPGASELSLMLIASVGTDDGLKMPPAEAQDKFPALSTVEVDKLRRWIDAGAPWPEDVKLQTPRY